MPKNLLALPALMGALIAMAPTPAAHASDAVQHLTLANHAFSPKEFTIPADTKVKILIKNENGQAAEFESFELHREKVIPDGEEVAVFVGPLKPGVYPFFDDLDVNKATGKITVK